MRWPRSAFSTWVIFTQSNIYRVWFILRRDDNYSHCCRVLSDGQNPTMTCPIQPRSNTLGLFHLLPVNNQPRPNIFDCWMNEMRWSGPVTETVLVMSNIRQVCWGLSIVATFPYLLFAVTFDDIACAGYVIETKIPSIILSSRGSQAAGRRSHSHHNIIPSSLWVLPVSFDFDPLQS